MNEGRAVIPPILQRVKGKGNPKHQKGKQNELQRISKSYQDK